jgi:polyphosphate kinase
MNKPKPDKEVAALRFAARLLNETADQRERLRRIKVPAAARCLGISKGQVEALFKVRLYGPKTRMVDLNEVEAFDKRRTLR